MSAHQVVERYAKSIIDLAQETGKLGDVVTDMSFLKESISSRDFYLFLKSPIISSGKKLGIISRLFEGKLSDLTFAFIKRITAKGRERNLPEIIEAFDERYKEMQGISTVKLVTAKPLDPAMEEKIKLALQSSDQTRNIVQLETSIDKNLIGGFVIDFGDRLYDASIMAQLNQIKKQFSA